MEPGQGVFLFSFYLINFSIKRNILFFIKQKHYIIGDFLAKKRLTKSRSNAVFGGVFAGMADYLETESLFLRASPFILTILIYLFFGSEAMFGIILAIIILYTGYWVALPSEED